MATMRIHAPAQPNFQLWIHDVVSLVKETMHKFMEAYDDAQKMAREADKRYPFTYWS